MFWPPLSAAPRSRAALPPCRRRPSRRRRSCHTACRCRLRTAAGSLRPVVQSARPGSSPKRPAHLVVVVPAAPPEARLAGSHGGWGYGVSRPGPVVGGASSDVRGQRLDGMLRARTLRRRLPELSDRMTSRRATEGGCAGLPVWWLRVRWLGWVEIGIAGAAG